MMLTRETCMNDIARYKRLGEEIKTMEQERDVLRDRIMKYMDEHDTDRIGGETIVAIRYRQFQNRLDTKGLERDYPELMRDYRYEKKVVFLKVM